MRKVVALTLALLLLCLSAGCSKNESPSEASKTESTDVQNPFQQNGENPMNMGSISHGPRNPDVDKNEKLRPIVYDGKEIQYDYYVKASGQAKNVGFLMYVNGIPQPYKTDQSNTDYKYMHIFNLENDDTEFPFSFRFSPVTGKKGEDLKVVILSIYNPSFEPDMDKTSSYGGYHAILPATYSLHLEVDAKPLDTAGNDVYGVATFSNEPVTSQLFDTLNNNGMRDIDMDIFNKEVFNLLYFDGELKTDNLRVNSSEKLRVQYMICGHADIEYETTFYINHQPIESSKGISHHTKISKGSISIITFEIETEKLKDFNTFYIVSTPKNASDYPDGIFESIKTQSILLYK